LFVGVNETRFKVKLPGFPTAPHFRNTLAAVTVYPAPIADVSKLK